jgi:hypothetical protein
MGRALREKFTPWDQLTAEERAEIQEEFAVHVQKAGADLTKGIYRNVNDEYRRLGAQGKWVMAYC